VSGKAKAAELHRCGWAAGGPLEQAYHDTEWGVPSRDPRHLFELLVLEGAQAGLSWSTILKKREGYRRAFAGFDVRKVARFDAARIERLLHDPGIVRNRAKVVAAVANAQAALAVERESGGLEVLLWELAGGAPVRNHWRSYRDAPAETSVSKLMSKELRRRGFRFVGPTICYAFMQAVGMVNDHETRCFRYREV
jgi:DNA-3-methyladenine glycosylase I